ncbi:MAG: ABC transporter ATP-binding protein [Eubacteriales bacterium]
MIYEVSNLQFSYNKQVPFLQDINFSVNKGEILSIIGANGAGKTTLLKCLLGIHAIDGGTIELEGIPIHSLGRALYKKVGFVPQAKQYTTNFLVEDMILMGRNAHIGIMNQPSLDDIEAVDAIIEYLQIKKLKNKTINQISGGELQMVLIARALISDPQVLILDEPESNLDWYNQLTILEVMEQLASKGIACIFNTHYPEHALRISDKTIMLKQGKMIAFGDSTQIINTSNLKSLYYVETVIDQVSFWQTKYPVVTCIAKVDKEL